MPARHPRTDNPMIPVLPVPMTEKEAYARLGWPEEGGLAAGRRGVASLTLPLCDTGGGANWFVTYCEPCGMSGVARAGHATEVGCGCCGKPFTKVVGR